MLGWDNLRAYIIYGCIYNAPPHSNNLMIEGVRWGASQKKSPKDSTLTYSLG